MKDEVDHPRRRRLARPEAAGPGKKAASQADVGTGTDVTDVTDVEEDAA